MQQEQTTPATPKKPRVSRPPKVALTSRLAAVHRKLSALADTSQKWRLVDTDAEIASAIVEARLAIQNAISRTNELADDYQPTGLRRRGRAPVAVGSRVALRDRQAGHYRAIFGPDYRTGSPLVVVEVLADGAMLRCEFGDIQAHVPASFTRQYVEE